MRELDKLDGFEWVCSGKQLELRDGQTGGKDADDAWR